MNKILNIAHRGIPVLEVENTISSFERALEIGCDGLEFDVHLTTDGTLIVFHDKDLVRMTEGAREEKTASLSLEEIKNVKLVNGEKIPTFNEVIGLLNSQLEKPEIQVEIKKQPDDREIVEKLLQELKVGGYLDKLYISSFEAEYLKRVKELNSEIRTIYLSRESEDLKSLEEILIENQIDGVHFKIADVEKKCVEHFKNEGFFVGAWKLKADKELIEKAIDLEMFRATSDAPNLFNEILSRKK